jgi:DNA-binding response OmpR family regulator
MQEPGLEKYEAGVKVSPLRASIGYTGSACPMSAPSNVRPQILVIDDDKKLCRLINEYLSPLGYSVTAAHTGPEGVEKATSAEWHAVILDLMLPGFDGFEVLKRDVPVLMLTARGDEADRIVGLEIGADDYLPKTFSTRELLARLRAVTRRTRAARKPDEPEPEVVVGSIRINTSAHTVVVGDEPLALTPVEYDLLLACEAARRSSRTSATGTSTSSTARSTSIFPRCGKNSVTMRNTRTSSARCARRAT